MDNNVAKIELPTGGKLQASLPVDRQSSECAALLNLQIQAAPLLAAFLPVCDPSPAQAAHRNY
jgi:hypothetical protein